MLCNPFVISHMYDVLSLNVNNVLDEFRNVCLRTELLSIRRRFVFFEQVDNVIRINYYILSCLEKKNAWQTNI